MIYYFLYIYVDKHIHYSKSKMGRRKFSSNFSPKVKHFNKVGKVQDRWGGLHEQRNVIQLATLDITISDKLN